MNKPPDTPLVRFYKTPTMRCPYLEGRQEQLVFTHLRGDNADHLHSVLAQAGFRRSHNIVYRPDCDGCAACIPVRVRAMDFAPRRPFRRVLKRNASLSAGIAAPIATAEQYELFARYQASRHENGSMSHMDFAEYRSMIEDTPVDTMLIEYREPDSVLYGVALTDRLRDGLSMVYSFFEPDAEERSPGTYIILDHIGRARAMALPYVYLGYWIADCEKMAYKRRFAPLEILGRTGWRLDARPG